jgi:hypothetical protein
MRRIAAAFAVAAVAAPTAAGAAQHRVKAPDGEYGGPHKLFMSVSAKTIDVLALNFPCGPGKGKGRMSLDDIALRKTSRGYKFSIKAHGIVGYSDGHPEENGVMSISGQFTRRAKSASGRYQAWSRRCGASGKLDWRAERESSQSSPSR